LLRSDTREEIIGYWEERFGVPARTFDPYLLMASSRTVYLVRENPGLELLKTMRIQNAGLPFIRKVAGYLKPTTFAVQRFGAWAGKCIANLSISDLSRLCRDGEIKLEKDFSPGYVILRTDGDTWGCSLFLSPDRLLCRLPKNLRKAIMQMA